MRNIVVFTGIDQLPPAERWPRFVDPLATALAHSGLGRVLDWDALQRQADAGAADLTEVAVELVNVDYGRELLDRVSKEAGIQRHAPTMPKRWREFGCSDYFNSKFAEHGAWNADCECWDILPAEQIFETTEFPFLVIGGPGFDGIEWGYRVGHTGVWVYKPIDDEFVWLAPTAEALLQGWLSGVITL